MAKIENSRIGDRRWKEENEQALENMAMEDIFREGGASQVNKAGRIDIQHPQSVTYTIATAYNYTAGEYTDAYGEYHPSKFYKKLYKLVYGPFSSKSGSDKNIDKLDRQNEEFGIPIGCYSLKIKGKWYVQFFATAKLGEAQDFINERKGGKVAKEIIKEPVVVPKVPEKPFEEKPKITPAPAYEPAKPATPEPVEDVNKPKVDPFDETKKKLSLNDENVRQHVDTAIGAVNRSDDPDGLEGLTEVTDAKDEIGKAGNFITGLYSTGLNEEQKNLVDEYDGKINGHEKRLNEAIENRELFLRTEEGKIKQKDLKVTPAIAAGQGTMTVKGVEQKRLENLRNSLTRGSNKYNVDLVPRDMPLMGEKRVAAFMDIAEKLHADANVRKVAEQKFYKKILAALSSKDNLINNLTFEQSYEAEIGSRYVFAATLALFWAYIFVNKQQFDSDITDKNSVFDRIQNKSVNRSEVTITEYHYRKVRDTVK